MNNFSKLAYCWPGKDNNDAFSFGHYLTHLAVTGFNFDENGKISTPQGFSSLLLLKQQGTEIMPVIQNLVQGDFDGKMLNQTLGSSQKRNLLVENCYRLVQQHQLSNIHLNLENYKGEAGLLTQFVQELYFKLMPNTKVSMALPAKTNITTWFNGYDYQALAMVSDYALLMTYDLHWPGGPPGPVGSLAWMEQVVDYAINKGWNKKQLILGIPLYGYDWPKNGRGKAILHHQVNALQAEKGIKCQWHPKYGESHFTYQTNENTHQVWFQDMQAVAVKVTLASKKGLAGVGFWRLGFQFPGVWQVLSRV